MFTELGRGLIMIALDSGFLERAIEAFDLPIGPGVSRLGEAVLDAKLAVDTVETVAAREELMGLPGELDTVVRQDAMHFVGPLLKHPAQKLGGHDSLGLWGQLGKGYFAGAVNGDKQLLATFFGLHFGKVDVQVANRIVLKLLFGRRLPLLAER